MKSALFSLFFLLSIPAFAAGPNDGIYLSDTGGVDDGYVTIHQNGDQVAFVFLDANFTWEAYQGTRTGDTAVLTLAAAGTEGSATFELEFVGESTATIELLSCEAGPGTVCNFQPGTKLMLEKIF